jgi:hypothetical protein
MAKQRSSAAGSKQPKAVAAKKPAPAKRAAKVVPESQGKGNQSVKQRTRGVTRAAAEEVAGGGERRQRNRIRQEFCKPEDVKTAVAAFEAAITGQAKRPPTPWEQWSAKPDALEELCSHIVSGGHLNGFCKERDIPYTNMLRWLDAEPGRSEMYARAREDRSDKLADEIVSISDESQVKVRTDADGNEVEVVLDAAAVARNRLRVDSRKWVAAKLKPRVYGEKVQVDANVNTKGMSDEQLLAQLAKFGINATIGQQQEPEGA